ncbi:MAG: hypothetical protein ACREGL_01140 [Alphaproteobacteria bacterium]
MTYSDRIGRLAAQGRIDRTVLNPYAFAFADWRLDRNGFPIP